MNNPYKNRWTGQYKYTREADARRNFIVYTVYVKFMFFFWWPIGTYHTDRQARRVISLLKLSRGK